MIINFKSFQVASEHFYFWLIALKFFCEAESLLNISCDSQLALDKQISEACAKYYKGITTLKVKKSLHISLHVALISGLCGIQLLEVFQLSPGLDASPWQGYSQH